ncbi:MAG: protein kinase domain-containing protein [Nocardioidaceae bacterium]
MQPELIGGRYRVLSAIGQGGMGTVWLCEDLTLRRQVAVKQVGLLPGESVTDSARALREARSTAALSHRNVVTVFDVVEEAGHVWLVMEHVPSRSLSDIIREDGPLDPARVASIGAQVAEGLAAAHAAGTTHRDVKPGNVLVREDGVAKISDFGIARNAADPALTQSGFVTGTPTYFSPELARGAAPDPAADVWALGATLYAAVEGHPPYRPQDNPMAVLHEIATRRPDRPTRAGFLEQPLMRMLDPDPKSRWAMADAAHALTRLADQHKEPGTRANTRDLLAAEAGAAETAGATEPTAATPAPAAPVPERERERRRRAPLAVLLGALLLLVLGGIAYAANLGGEGSSGASASGGRSGSPSARPSADASSPGPGPSPARSTHSTVAPASGTSKAAFLHHYYSTVPGNLDAGWAMLGPHEQSVGRSSYDDFWGSKRDVTVSHIDAVPGSRTVDATITYTWNDGRTTVERQRLELVRGGGGWLIDNDTVLSSSGG